MKNTMRIRWQLPAIGGVVAVLALTPHAAQAQSQELFACYVPNSGVVYRVNPPGSPAESPDLKDDCTGKKHVKFSWAKLAVANGKVGIGVPNPTVALDVAGDIHASGKLIIGNTITIDDATNSITSTSGLISFGDENLVTTGNVGIGTTAPTHRLHVQHSVGGNFAARIENPSATGLGLSVETGSSTPGFIAFRTVTGGVARFLILNDGSVRMAQGGGNVGIGAAAPGEKLTVAGTIQSTSGGFKFPDGTTQTTAAATVLVLTERKNTVTVPAGPGGTPVTASCQFDEVVSGGGFKTIGVGKINARIVDSGPAENRRQWFAQGVHEGINTISYTLEVFAQCLKIQPAG